MKAKPLYSAQHLLDYLLELQTNHDLTKIQVNYYDWHEDDRLLADYVILDTDIDKPVLLIE